ncbi:MAG TPA: hypothetical protein PK867_26120 [Pirellulales bacterium]|nr:hypothetical protein [Pirellulales bacterium]
MPGQLGEVFWGDPDKPLPNWREHPRPDGDEDDPEDRPLTPEQRKHLAAITGLDSAELFGSDGESEGSDDDDDDDEADEP